MKLSATIALLCLSLPATAQVTIPFVSSPTNPSSNVPGGYCDTASTPVYNYATNVYWYCVANTLPPTNRGTWTQSTATSLPISTTVNPNGTACSTNTVKVLSPGGTIYTCQNGTYAQASGGGGTLAGDVTGAAGANTVVKINGTSLAGLATGILKNTTGTGVPSIAVAGDFPTLNQNTSGNAATAINLSGGGCTTSSGSLSCTGSVTSGAGSGVAGADSLLQGTLPTFPTNSFTLFAPTAIATAYQWTVPAADAAGAIVSDGAGTPGALSIVGFSGTGNIARVTSPTFVTPVLGAATATSITSGTDTVSTQLIASTAARLSYITGSTQCLHVDTSGNVSGTGSDCGSGGGGGATTQLDNLSAVSINAALLAQTGIDLGSTIKPFQNLYLSGAGTYGTNYLKLTGTPTSTRTVTFPDATDTIAELGQANAFTAAQTTTVTAVAANHTFGLTATNTTPATNVTDQNSPCLALTGQSWSGSASQSNDYCIQNVTIGAAGYLEFLSRTAAGAWTLALTLEPTGVLDVKSTLNVAGNIIASAGNQIAADYFQDRAGTKGFWDNTQTNINWLNENRVNGNVNVGIRAKASQTADLLDFYAAGGTTILSKFDVAGNLTIVPQKSTTGARYLCIDTNGLIASSATACVGT